MSESISSALAAPSLDPVESLRPAGLEARLAGIMGALPDAILCFDREWRLTYGNDEAIRISRLEPHQFNSQSFWQMYPGLEGTELKRRYLGAMASGKQDQFEYYYEPFDVWVEIRLIPTDEGFAAVYRDITPRKHSEIREAALTRQSRLVFEATPDAIAIVDKDWRFAYANQRAFELVGRDDILGHDIFEMFPGNLQEPFNSTYRRTMATRQPHEFEAFQIAPINLWLRVEARPFEDGIIVFFSDITARKNAELREQETARRLAQVLEVTSDAIASLDREWRYSYLNANAEKLIDPERRLLGKNVWEEFPLAVGGPSWEIYHRAMDEGIPGYTELYYPEPINAWLALSAQPASDGVVVFFRDITAQRTHNEVVRNQLDLLQTVQTVSRVATWEIDVKTGAIQYGPGAFPVLGHPLESMATIEDMDRILLPGHSQRIRDANARSRETGEPILIEFAASAADGSLAWIEARAQAVKTPEGSTRLRGMSIDVTQRHLDQQDLVASEARYRVLADLNPQAIWMGDPQGKITYANQGFLAYLGLTTDSLNGEAGLNVFAPADRERVLEAWRRSVTTGVDLDLEAMICQAETREYRYWHLRAAPIRDASGHILHWLGVGQDIHETKTYTAALRHEQLETERRRAELETIYTTSPVGLALLDPVHFTFLNLNDHEAQMLGAAKSDLIGRPLSEIAPPDKVPGLLDLMRSVAAGNPVKNHLLEGELTSQPGEQRAWSVNYTPVFNEDGTVRAISTASIEITHQKKAEAALIQSEKLAAVGRLASSISHEINNPLEAITNLLYLVAVDPELPEGVKTYVHMAQSELSRVSQIATQTLRFHRQAVAPTYVTCAELVDAVIRLYTGRLMNSNIKVDARYLTETQILCFENDIRQVLNNLIANAIDAMRNGGRLIVRAHDAVLHSKDGPRPGVRITVADTGHGMKPATVERIFEPFFTTKDLNGTGLGLWISRGIVDRHQGSLRVRSSTHAERHGTVFSLFLPRKEAPVSGSN